MRTTATLPGDSAGHAAVVQDLVARARDIAHIHCVHNGATGWMKMTEAVRMPARSVGHAMPRARKAGQLPVGAALRHSAAARAQDLGQGACLGTCMRTACSETSNNLALPAK